MQTSVPTPSRIVVRSDETHGLYLQGALGLVAILAFVLTLLFSRFPELPILAVLFFSALIFMVGKGAFALRRKYVAFTAFGPLELVLEDPPTPGGTLQGTIALPAGSPGLDQASATLKCQLGYGKNARELSSETRTLAVRHDGSERHIQVAFPLPATALATGLIAAADDDPDGLSGNCRWELTINGGAPDVEPLRRFDIEVLAAPASGLQDAAQGGSSLMAQAALVFANLVPLALVIAGRESVVGLVAIYWAENVIVGFYTVLRMLTARRGGGGNRFFQALFFCVHFGGFCLIHGLIVVQIFLGREQSEQVYAASKPGGLYDLAAGLWIGMHAAGLFAAAGLATLLCLLVSHGVSFAENYIRNQRYLAVGPDDSFWRPYPRMFLMHLFILGAGFWTAQHGEPVVALAALVLTKTAIDLFTHRRTHRDAVVIPPPRREPQAPEKLNAPQRLRHNLAGILIASVIIVVFAYQSGLVGELRNHLSPPAKTMAATPLPPPTAWQTDTQGWEIPLPRSSPGAGIAGRGLRIAPEGNGWRVAFDRILIEKNPGAPDQQISGIAVHYDRSVGGGGSSGMSTQGLAAQLTAEAPVHSLAGQSFDFVGDAGCARASPPCRFWLEVRTAPASAR